MSATEMRAIARTVTHTVAEMQRLLSTCDANLNTGVLTDCDLLKLDAHVESAIRDLETYRNLAHAARRTPASATIISGSAA